MKQKKCLVMGILNITPDSFSDGGKYFNFENAIKHVHHMIQCGVDIIDIGGESTRPNANQITKEEELRRILPIIKEISKIIKDTNIEISIDTYKASVAEEALKLGAKIINDVSGLKESSNMTDIILKYNAKIVIMHNNGIPATKPKKNSHNIIYEVYEWLKKKTKFAISQGVKKENIILDPGIGFGKTAQDDMKLIENIPLLKELGYPILIGSSKKSFISCLYPNEPLEKKSDEIDTLIIENGADIIRKHF